MISGVAGNGVASPPSIQIDQLVDAARGFKGCRLTLAREAAGLDVSALAQSVGATPAAISQLEHERNRPRLETLLRLSLVLAVSPSFFAASETTILTAERCHFRRQRGASQTEIRRVLARGTLVQEVADYFARFLRFPVDAVSPLRQSVVDLNDVERAAEALRDSWKLGHRPIADMVALLEAKGVRVVEIEGHSSRLDAFSTWVGPTPTVFLSTDKQSATRRRFDCGHELGHLVMHGTLTCAGDPALEAQANRFAGAFLLPRGPFERFCPQRLMWPRLIEMKQRWGASLQLIVRRAYDLGVFSEATYRRANVHISRNGWKTAEPEEPVFERPQLLKRAADKLSDAGKPTKAMAKDLGISVALFQHVIAPRLAD